MVNRNNKNPKGNTISCSSLNKYFNNNIPIKEAKSPEKKADLEAKR